MRTLITGLLLTLALTIPHPSEARTWNILADGTGDATTIQAGIDSAAAGDWVVVQCGTYYEHDILMKAGVRLASSTGLADCVVVDAEEDGRGIACLNLAEDAAHPTVIEGFTFTDGLGYCEPNTPWPGATCRGGGILIDGSTVTVVNCDFVKNQEPVGVGDFLSYGGGGACDYSTVTFTRCRFTSNVAMNGSGLSCNWSNVELKTCSFVENPPQLEAGGGGGMACYESDVVLSGCVFWRNASWAGGAGVSGQEGSALFERCTFVENSAMWGAAGIRWLQSYPDPVMLVRNTIISFSASGSAIECISSDAVDISCTDIYGNAGGDWTGFIAGQAGVNGNFSLDPLFCDRSSGDFRVKECSPCAPWNYPPGSTCIGFIGASFYYCPGTAVASTTWGRIKTIFR